MSPWARVPPGDGLYCGGCDALLPPGAPVSQITMARGQRLKGPLMRCEACAGAAPPDLPALPERVAPEPVAWTPAARLAFDWRARAAGMTTAREPGEDDA